MHGLSDFGGAIELFDDMHIHRARKSIKVTYNSSRQRGSTMRERLGLAGYVLHRGGVLLGLRFGGSFFYPSDDREVLENVIFPFYQLSSEHNDIVMAGTDWYTHGYGRMFSHKKLATIDLDPRKARFGATRHIVDSVTRLDAHFADQSLDLVTLNGLIGWGLNGREDAELAIGAIHRCLRPGGHLIAG